MLITIIMKARVARGWIRQDLAADSESTLTSAQGSCRLISIQMIIKTVKMMAKLETVLTMIIKCDHKRFGLRMYFIGSPFFSTKMRKG